MALSKIRIGDYISPYKEKCNIPNLTAWDVSGVNKYKEFFEPSQQVGNDTSDYKVVPPLYFACNLMHVGRDVVLPIAINNSSENKIVSPAYTVFKLNDERTILRKYLFILLNSSEKDRYFWFHCDSSVRDGMEWSSFCDIELELPDLPTQQKYVDIYEAMVENQKAYETGLEDLKLTCDAYIEKLRRDMPCEKIGKYIEEYDERNNGEYGIEQVKGITTQKEFIDTKADMNGVLLTSYKIVRPNSFAYVSDTSRRGNKVSLAFNDSNDSYLVSSITTTVRIKDENLIAPYLFLLFKREEFDRYARYHSWGSARETLEWDALCSIKIPVPTIKVQQEIADIFCAYYERKVISDRLKAQLKDMCPILIKGSLEEAKGDINA